jgi:hypothetical protein
MNLRPAWATYPDPVFKKKKKNRIWSLFSQLLCSTVCLCRMWLEAKMMLLSKEKKVKAGES